ncbi:mCG140604, isoform CRA_d, partial [Mus musculus]
RKRAPGSNLGMGSDLGAVHDRAKWFCPQARAGRAGETGILRGSSGLAFGIGTQSPVWVCREPCSGCFIPLLGQLHPEFSF